MTGAWQPSHHRRLIISEIIKSYLLRRIDTYEGVVELYQDMVGEVSFLVERNYPKVKKRFGHHCQAHLIWVIIFGHHKPRYPPSMIGLTWSKSFD